MRQLFGQQTDQIDLTCHNLSKMCIPFWEPVLPNEACPLAPRFTRKPHLAMSENRMKSKRTGFLRKNTVEIPQS
jgi:hypothetical protein